MIPEYIEELRSAYERSDALASDHGDLRKNLMSILLKADRTLDDFVTDMMKLTDVADLETLLVLLFPNDEDYLRQVHRLMDSDYRSANEDMLHFIQQKARPESVYYLQRAIERRQAETPYVGLSMFCYQAGFALGAIGTPEALELIKAYAASNDLVLRTGMRQYTGEDEAEGDRYVDEYWY